MAPDDPSDDHHPQRELLFHVLHALAVAAENPRAVLDSLISSADPDAALDRLRAAFGFDQVQGQAVLDLQWKDLTAEWRRRLVDEHADASARHGRLGG